MFLDIEKSFIFILEYFQSTLKIGIPFIALGGRGDFLSIFQMIAPGNGCYTPNGWHSERWPGRARYLPRKARLNATSLCLYQISNVLILRQGSPVLPWNAAVFRRHTADRNRMGRSLSDTAITALLSCFSLKISDSTIYGHHLWMPSYIGF